MKYNLLNGQQFYNMVINASNRLEEESDFVNSLNVFPVPDGDTGTNMSMTFKAAVREIEGLQDRTIGEISKKLAKGALMGARGNSGVILSQILRGISKGLEGKTEVTIEDLKIAFSEGSNSAYKAVMRPTEGTILTIIRAAKEACEETDAPDILALMEFVCDRCKEVLDKTPEMLPALKKARVVDSGGMGLLIILKGMYEALSSGLDFEIIDSSKKGESIKTQTSGNVEDIEIKFGYCTEFIIIGDASKANDFKAEIESLGDSMIVVGYDNVIKAHIHTNDPGLVLSKAVKLGELSKIKIDNMREEHRNLLEEGVYSKENIETTVDTVGSDEKKKYAFVSVAMGSGIKNIFSELGVDYVIEGGQTMNPSTQDILDCVNKLNAEHIFVLPNNKNIVMAANQAADISDKDIRVIPTKTIPQGITCITMFNPEADVEENYNELIDAIEMVKTGSVTYAVRDTEMDGIEIKEGNILGLLEGKIKQVGEDKFAVAEEILDKMIDSESELITVFYGSDCNDTEIEEFTSKLEEKYSELDVQCYKGEQPLYYFIMSVE